MIDTDCGQVFYGVLLSTGAFHAEALLFRDFDNCALKSCFATYGSVSSYALLTGMS